MALNVSDEPPGLPRLDLDDRYAAGAPVALLGGVQAIVRLILEQRRLDDARGLRTGAFVSGYPG
jgi:indolepyruvate ferredoxin oxidoreductase